VDRRGESPLGAAEGPFAAAARPIIPLQLPALPVSPMVACLGRFDHQSVGISNCR
jgi:hypothetical protein